MNSKIILLLSFSFVSNLLWGQLNLKIQPPSQTPCVDSVITFYVTDESDAELSGVELKWSFGDGSTIISGTDIDSVEHTFTKGGGYIIMVSGANGLDTDSVFYQFEIALTPNFSGTKSDREEPICMGQEILLTGVINDSTWVYEIPDKSEEESPLKIPDASPYEATFDYRIFEENEKVTDGSEIDTIMVKLEHDNLAHVQVELICPNGTGIVLKSIGGQDGIDLGVPNSLSPSEAGTPYVYYWTDFGTNTAMDDVVISLPDTLMPEGEYGSESNFNSLADCPLNGEWKIRVLDDDNDSQGYVFASQLTLKGQQIFTNWEYSHTYSQIEWLGENGYVSSTNPAEGTALAIPDVRGNVRYTFKTFDNFGCRQDTSILNTVEAVSFTATPDTGAFNLDVEFNGEETSWANEFEWDFGDESDVSIEDKPIHTYETDGVFRALLTAKTGDGCSDTASLLITVTIPESSLNNIPNSFSPDQNGKNELFHLKEDGLDAIEFFECYIYSRWGKKVAEWHSTEEAVAGWDGKINGRRDASPGVYFYYIKAIGFDGKVYDKKGFVHLFRNN